MDLGLSNHYHHLRAPGTQWHDQDAAEPAGNLKDHHQWDTNLLGLTMSSLQLKLGQLQVVVRPTRTRTEQAQACADSESVGVGHWQRELVLRAPGQSLQNSHYADLGRAKSAAGPQDSLPGSPPRRLCTEFILLYLILYYSIQS